MLSNFKMVALLLRTVLVLILPNIYANDFLQKKSTDFGPYTCTWGEYKLCKGPKAKNLTDVAVKLEKEKEDYIAYFNFTFPAQAHIEEVKIEVNTLKGNAKNIFWSYNVKNPCQHFLFTALIERDLNAHNCVIDKGHYIAVLNISNVAKTIIGPSSFYGEYSIQANALSKKGNIVCIYMKMIISKQIKVSQ